MKSLWIFNRKRIPFSEKFAKRLTTPSADDIISLQSERACSSAGRALRSQRRGQGFDPLQVHQNKSAFVALLFFAWGGANVFWLHSHAAGNVLPNRGVTLKIKILTATRFSDIMRRSWGISAVGSAQHWQCWGQGFKSPMLHQTAQIRTFS